VTVEYLASEAPPRKRPTWLVGGAILAVVAVVAGFLWWSDSLSRSANQSMLSTVRTVEDQSRIGEGQVMSTLEYASPMIWSTSVSEEVRAGLRELVQRSAADASAALEASAAQVDDLRILPWQTAQSDARRAVLDYIAAQRIRFDRISEYAGNIGTVMAEPGPPPDAAYAALRASGAVDDANR
jgi:hypothetical protein